MARASAFQAECCEFESRHPLIPSLGCRQAGKALGFEPSIRRFESYYPSILLRGGEVVSRWAHNPEVVGSSPTSAIYAEMVELVDTLGLEPGALWCVGSNPTLGNYIEFSIENYNKNVINDPTCSKVAQLVEQVAVNHWVVGSSPSLGVLFINLLTEYNL